MISMILIIISDICLCIVYFIIANLSLLLYVCNNCFIILKKYQSV